MTLKEFLSESTGKKCDQCSFGANRSIQEYPTDKGEKIHLCSTCAEREARAGRLSADPSHNPTLCRYQGRVYKIVDYPTDTSVKIKPVKGLTSGVKDSEITVGTSHTKALTPYEEYVERKAGKK